MAKGLMHKQDTVPGEALLQTLVSIPRYKLDLVTYEADGETHFLLRKIKFFSAENVKGSEIKFGTREARAMATAILRSLPEEENLKQPERFPGGSLLTNTSADRG